jgi:molybdenum-dependent DNA-binding transcriptional regulator ModE
MSNRPHLPITASRIRRDGWTNSRRVTFFVTLPATGSVTLAAASVGMSRKSAYALKKRDRTFFFFWNRGLAMAGKW